MQQRIMLLLACLAACGGRDTTAPGDRIGDVTLYTDHPEYRPLERVVVTTTNRTGHVLYDDHCAGQVEGYEFVGRWNASYGMGRACALDAGGWRAHSVPIPDGTSHVDTLFVNGRAYTGTWRVQLYLRDESGLPLPEDQRISNTFRVEGTWLPGVGP